MRRRDLLTGGLAAAALAAGCGGQAATGGRGEPRYRAPVPLPPPVTHGQVPLEQAIGRRRSRRTFRPGPLPAATIGQLLWAGQGITGAGGKRAAPSAGALYPLELYVVTATEVMHYLPEGHRAETRAGQGLPSAMQSAAFGQEPVGTAPAVIVVAAVPERTRARYGARAATFVALEAGHAAQNILLEAAARDLAAVPVGSIDPAGVAAALALPAGQTVLYLIPVGLPA